MIRRSSGATRGAVAVLCGAAAALLLAQAASAQDYRCPIGDDDYGTAYITAYWDHGGAGVETDWNCGSATYDGHGGTDIGIGSWPGMEEGRDVVAGADGTVTYVNDGEFDECSTGACAGGGGYGNYATVEHADGKVTYYGHMKQWSIIVSAGDAVVCGQKLGEVGSSGYSTGPHLHFEVRSGGVSYDPYDGDCSGPPSWWTAQNAYLELPGTECEGGDPPPDPTYPLISLDAAIDDLAGQPRDFATGGASAGVFDAFVGQTFTQTLTVTNAPEATARAEGVVAALEAAAPLEVLRWDVFDNYPGNACGGDWCPNSANDNPANPPHDAPGSGFDLAMDGFAAGEQKRIVLSVRGTAPTPLDGHAALRLFVRHVDGAYDKSAWDATPDNVNGWQTWNGGDLRIETLCDIWPRPGAKTPWDDGGGESEGEGDGEAEGEGEGEGGPENPGADGTVVGGCGCALGRLP